MKKRALIVGINYVGTGNDLKGCINDANNMHEYLQTKGFTEFKLVLEKEATTAGIKSGLEWLVEGAGAGDILFFHYSGHGSQLPSKTEPDGFEEIICPIDLNWRDKVITDDTLRQIFNKVPFGVNITLLLDCCHSGTMLDQTESFEPGARSLTKSKTKKKIFSRYLKPPAAVYKKVTNRTLVDWNASRDVNTNALLIAGCQSNQTSADAYINGKYQGAATASLLKSVKNNESITYKQLITEMREFMKVNKFTQVPQLDGSHVLYDKVFLDPFMDDKPAPAVVSTEVAEPTPNPVDTVETEVSVDSVSTMRIIAYASLTALLIAILFAIL